MHLLRKIYQSILCSAVLCAASLAAQAATYTVTNTADGGAGSLRAAVQTANSTAANDTINFAIPANDANCTAGGVCTITLITGELPAASAAAGGTLTISNSTGTANLVIFGSYSQSSSANASRVFYVNPGGNLTLNGLTVTGGSGQGTTNAANNGLGGAIFNPANANLTLTNVTVSNSSTINTFGVATGGGGIYNFGTLSVANSTISGNAGGDGGGIYNGGTATVTTTTFDSNQTILGGGDTATQNGGGLYNSAGTMTVTDSTVSNNTSSTGGGISCGGGTINVVRSVIYSNFARNAGGIFNSGTAAITNSTVSGNNTNSFNGANVGGGIVNTSANFSLLSVTVTRNGLTGNNCTNCTGGIYNSGTATLRNTLVAGNTNLNGSPADFLGTIAAASSFNLLGVNTGTTGITNGTNNNQVGTAADPINARLGVLANNGGPTLTHALLTNSPAIDKGNSFGLTTDQRGSTRPLTPPNPSPGDGSDIGAYETQNMPTAAAASILGRVMANKRGLANARVILTGTGGTTRTVTTNSFGYFTITDVETGATYIVSVSAKRYVFVPQIFTVTADLTGLTFTGQP